MLPIYQESKPTSRGQVIENVESNKEESSTYQLSLLPEGFSHTFLQAYGAKKATSGTRQSSDHVQPEQWGKTVNRYSKLIQIRVTQDLAQI